MTLLHAAALLSFAAAVLTAACRPDRTPEILGTWQAVYLLEEGDTVDVKLDNVSLRFDTGGHYVYTSTLDYFERGRFELVDDILTTRPEVDTVGQQRVRVTRLTPEGLTFLMSDGGKARVLGFARVRPADSTGAPAPLPLPEEG